MSTCADCRNNRNKSGFVYCLLLGIMIRSDYDGCRDHEREKSNGETGEAGPAEGMDAGGRLRADEPRRV